MADAKYRSLAAKKQNEGLSDLPIAGGYEYVGKNASKAGAGRGSQGNPQGPAEMGADERAIREEMDFKKYSKESPEQKYAGGGMTASARADGIAQRGKTRGKMV
jgi:hypothetical protein